MYKRPETAETCPNKQFQNKSLFSLPICQEEINKVVFVWVYELENNSKFKADSSYKAFSEKGGPTVFQNIILSETSLWALSFTFAD